jgi:hypothetical protein
MPWGAAGGSATTTRAAPAAHALQQAQQRLAAQARALLGARADSLNPDQLEAAIADRAPGFAGLVAGAGGYPIVRMTQRSGLFDAQGRLVLTWRSSATPAARWVQGLGPRTGIGLARWDARELLDFKHAALQATASAGVTAAWIDRRANHVQLVYDQALGAGHATVLAQRLHAAGLPAGACVARPAEPMTPRN